ncbi:hypothetical protein C2G38_2197519 [Gigaspora rosea]|uniref:Uncharacterized protein n=1 Tax=Gigaspora rosea TaxID=44941 RepID=A0A397UTH9_9GLOM|nr:hypothetical protein C2G38_2197519 [Gigaspora rosea]
MNECNECEKIMKNIKILECLVDNLDEELGIPADSDGVNNLEKQQQIQVEELIKTNETLFAEGLTQLGQTKEETHQITVKEEAEPIKQNAYRVSHTENKFIAQEVAQMIKHGIVRESTSP